MTDSTKAAGFPYLFVCLSVCASILFQTNCLAESPTKPNVVLILADDMGLDSVSRFNGRLGLKTNAIDQLAREGFSFTDAHSTSGVCSPTRYAVLTGRYSWRTRMKRGIVNKWQRPLIADQRLTLAEIFKAQGYKTACIGKWHLGWNWPKQGGGFTEKLNEIDFQGQVKGGPCDHGFDSYFGDDVPNWPPYAWCENDQLNGKLISTIPKGEMIGVSAGPAVENWDFRAVLSEYTKRWAGFIRKQADSEQPFFLYAPMPSPHTPIAPHSDFVGRSNVSKYADFLLQTDHAVGEILRALKETNQEKNTIVIFTCDNGTSPKANFSQLAKGGIRVNENWRGWKSDVYEGGHRVPFIVRWPDKIKPNQTSQQIITVADCMATCAEAIQFDLPENAAEDSCSLMPELLGKGSGKTIHESVIHHSGSGRFAIRKGKWKLLFCRGSGGWSPPSEKNALEQGLPPIQLFDLETDPKESKNVQADYPAIVQELTENLREVVTNGRSTPGLIQSNHANQTSWPGLPWNR